jgi:TPR repeat protein
VKGLGLFAVLITTVFVFVGCTDETVDSPVLTETTIQTETKTLTETKALAEAGNTEAQFRLGSFYAEGKVVPNDFTEAAKWFNKAGEQGHAEALYFLGVIHIRGFGTPPDNTQGYIWFCLAAKAGFESATEDCNHFAGELSPEVLTIANKRIDELFGEIQLGGYNPTS